MKYTCQTYGITSETYVITLNPYTCPCESIGLHVKPIKYSAHLLMWLTRPRFITLFTDIFETGSYFSQ